MLAKRLIPTIAVLLLASSWWTATVQAQPAKVPEPSFDAAEKLFFEAEKHRAAGNLEEACKAYAESYELAPRVAALRRLADCNIAAGKMATAQFQLHEVIRLAKEANRPEVAQDAEQLLAQIRPRVSWLTVHVERATQGVRGLQITVNKQPLERAEWGRPFAVDPGPHTVKAVAPGYKPWIHKFTMNPDGDRKATTVEFAVPTAPPGGYPPPGYAPRTAPPYRTAPPPARYPLPPEALQADHLARPRVLPYVEGDAIPPGYHRDTQIRKKLVIAGASVLGGLWILSMVGASVEYDDRDGTGSEDDVLPLYAPIVGPFITMGTAKMEAFTTSILIIDGIGQVGGAALLIAGLAAQEDVLVRDKTPPALTVAPSFGPHHAGLSLAGSL